jgi:prevent-host-death family protein
MHVPVSEAKAQLTELVRRAEAGDEIILTRHGQPVVRLAAVRAAVTRQARADLLHSVRTAAASRKSEGPAADRSQDFLFGPEGLPK